VIALDDSFSWNLFQEIRKARDFSDFQRKLQSARFIVLFCLFSLGIVTGCPFGFVLDVESHAGCYLCDIRDRNAAGYLFDAADLPVNG